MNDRVHPAHLSARPELVLDEARTGLVELRVFDARPALLYVPDGYRCDYPAALVVMLHGSGASPRHGLAPLFALADEAHLMLLAPASRRYTWDAVLGGFGDDVEIIDELLALVFAAADCELEHFWVAPTRMGEGIGRALFTHAVEHCRAIGARRLWISADPNAEGFYARMRARRVGEVPSTPAGRRLPRLDLLTG